VGKLFDLLKDSDGMFTVPEDTELPAIDATHHVSSLFAAKPVVFQASKPKTTKTTKTKTAASAASVAAPQRKPLQLISLGQENAQPQQPLKVKSSTVATKQPLQVAPRRRSARLQVSTTVNVNNSVKPAAKHEALVKSSVASFDFSQIKEDAVAEANAHAMSTLFGA
jgi:hypothetical protein